MKKITIRKIDFPIITIALFFALSTWCVSAQKPENEFSIYGEGGFAAFRFQPMIKNASSKGYGGDAGVGFTGFISPNWGIHTDVGIGFFNVKNTVNSLTFITSGQTDCEGYLYNLHSTLNNYKETHKAIFLTVPLMLQFQTKMNQNQKVGYYALAGGKAQFLFNYKYTSKIALFNNAAYYPEFDNWITSLPILGLGVFEGNSAAGKLEFGILAMLAFETGAKWRISESVFLYTGAYFDYGLHEPTQKIREPYKNYTSPEQLKEPALLAFTDRLNLMTVGIKLRLGINPQSPFSKPQKLNGPCPYR